MPSVPPTLPLALLAALAACAAPFGARPSAEALAALQELYAREYPDDSGWFGGGRLLVAGAAETNQTVIVLLERGGVVHHLPVATDGDVADLWRRVQGAPHPDLGGPLSAGYRRATR